METSAIRERLVAHSASKHRGVSVCLIGQPYWTDKLERSLNLGGRGQLRAFALPLKAVSVSALWQSLSAEVIVSVGYRPGAPTWRGRAFDALWTLLRVLNPTAVRVFYWLGTDVLNTTEDGRAGRLRQASLLRAKKDHHLADATWLVDELRQMHIHALHKTVTVPELSIAEAPALPESFSVLTYIPDGRYRFYGGMTVYQAAKDLPEVRFDVVGGSGTWIPEPLPNLVFHGWQADMMRFHQQATVLVRLVQHDGTGLTALEALSLGRHVIYSHPLACTTQVAWDDTESLVRSITHLLDQHRGGTLRHNTAGMAYVRQNFNHHDCTRDLVHYFLSISSGTQSRRHPSNEQ